MRRVLIALFAVILMPSPAIQAAETPPGKVYVYKQSGGKPQEMEIYFPPNHDPAKVKVPGLILFHGGGWSGGTLSQFRNACEYFANRGLVTATVNYRMLDKVEAAKLPKGETRKRVCITDAKTAIRWFKQHAEELGIDPQRVITGGGSAGGHISVLATLNPGLNDPADRTEVDTSVVAYILFNPAFAGDDHQDSEVDVLRFLKHGYRSRDCLLRNQRYLESRLGRGTCEIEKSRKYDYRLATGRRSIAQFLQQRSLADSHLDRGRSISSAKRTAARRTRSQTACFR